MRISSAATFSSLRQKNRPMGIHARENLCLPEAQRSVSPPPTWASLRPSFNLGYRRRDQERMEKMQYSERERHRMWRCKSKDRQTMSRLWKVIRLDTHKSEGGWRPGRQADNGQVEGERATQAHKLGHRTAKTDRKWARERLGKTPKPHL